MKSSCLLVSVKVVIFLAIAECQLICRKCNDVKLASECDSLEQCQNNEHCLTAKVIKQGETFFNSRCVPDRNCSSRQTTGSPFPRNTRFLTDTVVCSECCSQQDCNTTGCGLRELECKERLKDGYFYDSLTGICAKVVKSPSKTYNQTEAAEVCKKDGAKLITITSEEQQYFLLSWVYTRYEKDEDFWIGLEAPKNSKNHYIWPRGQSITFKYWGRAFPEQPNGKWTGDENCVFINSKDDNLWHDENCDRMLSGYICEIWNLTDRSQLPNICRQKVFQGYLYDQRTNMCINLIDSNTDQFTHKMASDNCKQDGVSLATIDTSEKSTLVSWWIYSTRGNGTDFWIGAKDLSGNTSVFTWPNGANISTGFTNWGGPDFSSKLLTQPDGFVTSRNQSCVYMDHLHEYKWFDENCGKLKNGFICQHFGNTSFLSLTIDNCLYRLQRGYFYDPCNRLCIQIKNSEPISRSEAARICKLNGDRLVEIDTQDKMTYLQYLALSVGKSNNDFWIGAVDSSESGHFKWEYTNRPLNYTNWYTVKPEPDKNCVVLDHADQYRWTPTECSARKHGFVCHLDNIALSSSNGR